MPGLRSPMRSYEEENGNLKEAEIMQEQVNLDQESPIFIRFETGPSNFLKFVFSEDQPEAELEQQQQPELGEDNHHAEDKLQENVPKENKPEEEEEKQEDKQRRQYEQEEPPEKRQRTPSTSSQEDECQAPLSPKITDRTESPSQAMQKSNIVKKTPAPLPVSKIDDKLEQYTQAIEISSKILKSACQASIDLPTNCAAVASTKSLWETGEVAQTTKSAPCKDIVAGDIVNIRRLWERKERAQTDTNSKVKIPGKKYKYVAVGHGQYKRVPIEDDGVTEK